MGNTISSTGTVNELSASGTIIGFISFAFTFATFLRVTWDILRTLWSTTREVHGLLPNLKQALFEERSHLRGLRRRCRGQYDEGAFDVLAHGLRDMVEQFEELEQPFLKPEYRHYDEKGYFSHQRADDVYESQYKLTYGLKDRYLWLRRRGAALDMSNRLSRMQTRRIARQSKDLAMSAPRLLTRAEKTLTGGTETRDSSSGPSKTCKIGLTISTVD